LSSRPIKVAVLQAQPDDLTSALSSSWLAKIADAALSALALPDTATIEVVVTDDETVRELNRRHRGLDETTDVLSFATGQEREGGFVLPPCAEETASIGEIVISGPQSARQAARNGRKTADEVAFLMAHGILHLMGHDHEEPDERSDMEAEHRRLLVAMLGASASSIKVEYPA
jgi:probable rRNA maturation factor